MMDFIADSDSSSSTVAELIADSVFDSRFTNLTCDPTPIPGTDLSWWVDWLYDADYEHSVLVRVFRRRTHVSVRYLWLCWPANRPLHHVWDGDPQPFFDQRPSRRLDTCQRFVRWTHHLLDGDRVIVDPLLATPLGPENADGALGVH